MWLAVNGMGGLDALKAVIPAQPLDFNVALALVVGSFISAGTLTADFVRFGRNAKLAVLVAMVAFFLGNSLMFIFGAAGAAALGMADISDVMIAQGLLLPAIVVLGLNIWTTNDNALYASGLGFANITGMSSKTLSVINGIIGTVCALWLYNNFVGWLTFLSAAIPPVGGVIIADYLMNRRRYEHFATTRMMSVNWVAILAVALGIAAGHWLPGIVPVNAVLGGALSYLILNPILRRSWTRLAEGRFQIAAEGFHRARHARGIGPDDVQPIGKHLHRLPRRQQLLHQPAANGLPGAEIRQQRHPKPRQHCIT